jgi:KUP system potassium uptake protein
VKKGQDVGKIAGISFSGLLVTLGIVYGDIGTSPLYVMNAIARSSGHIDQNFILGALSCIIWTLTLQTTFKYVVVTLKADNKGEGGIFSLFALIRRKMPWAYIFAIIGGSTLLSEGIITPAITVTSAIEGLHIYNTNVPVIPIVLGIISLLFFVQQFGTKLLGSSFGPIMVVWFSMLAILGLSQIMSSPVVFKAFNPYYAYKLIVSHPAALLLLGAIFLCTTGVEALYSDLGHCGLKNIRITWIFVKTTLILNYLGQGAFLLAHGYSGHNPFFAIMPDWFLLPGIIISTAAAIIASQALISGAFTLISVAISLNLWPKMKKSYPTNIKGQVYIPAINWFLFIGCVFIILFFKEAQKMEAAYGLSVTLTMMMTTTLLLFYLMLKKINPYLIGLFIISYLVIESTFLVANLLKFAHGGWITIAIASAFFIIMYGWHNARKLRNSFFVFVKISDYMDVITALSKDKSVPKYSTNLVYITRANHRDEIESKIIYSIMNKQPKRADVYWFLHADILDDPYTFEYEVTHIVPGTIIKIDFRLGFKVEPRINMYFKQVLDEMELNNEIDLTSRYESLRKFNIDSDFVFVIIDRIPNYDYEFSPHDKFMMGLYKFLRKIGIGEMKAFGLDTSNVIIEKVPLMVDKSYKRVIKRRVIQSKDKQFSER